MQLSLYKPSELENWINEIYRQNGIHYAADLDLDSIADLFGVEIRTYAGPSFARWEEESYSFIFLNGYLSDEQRREIFFHELAHPLQHVGHQVKMPSSFQQLQEFQAAQFQLYAAMPAYMFEEFIHDIQSYSALIKVAAEEFRLSGPFVKKRVKQIHSRIAQEEWDQRLRSREKATITYDHVKSIQAEYARKYEEEQRRIQFG